MYRAEEVIGFAERSSLIIDIDTWVLDAVARQMAEWQDDPRHRDVPVAVNVSGRHLADDRFVSHLLAPLDRHGIDPRGLIIEVTESALFDDLAAAAVKLQQLRDQGILVSIDTGHLLGPPSPPRVSRPWPRPPSSPASGRTTSRASTSLAHSPPID